VGPSAGARLRRRERLHRGAEFRRVFRQGLRLDGPLFLLVAVENAEGFARLGLASGRTVGGAAARNRAKRLLRESLRRHKIAGALDLVLVPKREIVASGLEEVEREYRQRLRRLASRRRARARGAGPPPAN
jgi:ribonuclease P protein component